MKKIKSLILISSCCALVSMPLLLSNNIADSVNASEYDPSGYYESDNISMFSVLVRDETNGLSYSVDNYFNYSIELTSIHTFDLNIHLYAHVFDIESAIYTDDITGSSNVVYQFDFHFVGSFSYDTSALYVVNASSIQFQLGSLVASSQSPYYGLYLTISIRDSFIQLSEYSSSGIETIYCYPTEYQQTSQTSLQDWDYPVGNQFYLERAMMFAFNNSSFEEWDYDDTDLWLYQIVGNNTGYFTIDIPSMTFGDSSFMSVYQEIISEKNQQIESLQRELDNKSVFSNVFGLFGQAFTAIGGFFSIEIAPNITLGLVFSIPIVVFIAILIFKLIGGN